jgi:hypothetical protein
MILITANCRASHRRPASPRRDARSDAGHLLEASKTADTISASSLSIVPEKF